MGVLFKIIIRLIYPDIDMSNKEFNKYIKEFKNYGKKVTASDESKKQFLIGLGILTEKGKPTKKYLKITSGE